MGRKPPPPAHMRHGLGLDHLGLVALDGEADGADHPVVLLEQLGDHEPILELHPAADEVLPASVSGSRAASAPLRSTIGGNLSLSGRSHVLVGVGQADGLAVLLQEPHAPRAQVGEALPGIAEHQLVPVAVVHVLADDVHLVSHWPRSWPHSGSNTAVSPGVRSLAGAADIPLVDQQHVQALLHGPSRPRNSRPSLRRSPARHTRSRSSPPSPSS